MTDRELLDLAAKAAGAKRTDYSDRTPDHWVIEHSDGIWRKWDPLTDDGDALRLAVKLRIELDHGSPQDNNLYVCAWRCGIEGIRDPVSVVEEFEDESGRLDATRRAITRAAAEICKTMDKGE